MHPPCPILPRWGQSGTMSYSSFLNHSSCVQLCVHKCASCTLPLPFRSLTGLKSQFLDSNTVYLNQTLWILKEEIFPLLSIRTHSLCAAAEAVIPAQWNEDSALKCQTCPSELRHFLEQVDRGLCWESTQKQAQSSMLICTGSQRGPPVIAFQGAVCYLGYWKMLKPLSQGL